MIEGVSREPRKSHCDPRTRERRLNQPRLIRVPIPSCKVPSRVDRSSSRVSRLQFSKRKPSKILVRNRFAGRMLFRWIKIWPPARAHWPAANNGAPHAESLEMVFAGPVALPKYNFGEWIRREWGLSNPGLGARPSLISPVLFRAPKLATPTR